MSLLDKFTKRANTDQSKPRKEFASQILELSKTQQPKGRGMERKYDCPLSSGLAEKFYIHKTFRQENVRNTGLVCRLDARESKKDITKRLVKKKPNQVDVEKKRDKAINKNIGQTTTQSQNKNSSEFLSSTNSHMCLKRKCKERSNLTRLQTLLCSQVHRPQAGKSPSPMLQNQQEKGEINTLTQMWRAGNRDHNKLQKQFWFRLESRIPEGKQCRLIFCNKVIFRSLRGFHTIQCSTMMNLDLTRAKREAFVYAL